jgi:hypothetical protein
MYILHRPAVALVVASREAKAGVFAFRQTPAFCSGVAVACLFVCHPVGICFCRCCCLFSSPPKENRHLDRSRAVSSHDAVERPRISPLLPVIAFASGFDETAVTGQQLGSRELGGFPSSGEVYEFLHRRDGERKGPREVLNRVGPEGYTQVFEPWRWGDSESDGRDD